VIRNTAASWWKNTFLYQHPEIYDNITGNILKMLLIECKKHPMRSILIGKADI